MTLSRKQAAALLGISISTLQRRTRSGQYQATKTGAGQFADVAYTHSGIGLPEPEVASPVEPPPEPKPIEVLPPKPEPSAIDTRIEADRQFAQSYLSGEATDSSGNRVDGTNRKFPTVGAVSLLGPRRPPEPKKPQSGTAHMDPRLLSDSPDPTGAPPLIPRGPQESKTGFTVHGSPLAAGISQEAYDEMTAAWRRNGGGRSMGEQEMATRRSKDVIHSAFPKADRT